MILSESKCRKLHTGKHSWSPTFQLARRKKIYWDLTVKHLYGLHIPMRRICKLHKYLKMSFIPTSLAMALEQQKCARREYKRIKRRSHNLRITFREDLASAIASHKQISHSAALRELINREESRDTHKRIKWMRQRYKSQSTSGVMITQPNGRKTLITDKTALETTITKENEMKFHQTEGQCPLIKGQLLQDIGMRHGP